MKQLRAARLSLRTQESHPLAEENGDCFTGEREISLAAITGKAGASALRELTERPETGTNFWIVDPEKKYENGEKRVYFGNLLTISRCSVKTSLDSGRTWFLYTLAYSGELQLVVTEGFTAETPEDVRVGDHVITGCHAIAPSSESRYFSIRFRQFVAWQVLDESFSHYDEREVRDDKSFVQILEKSAYLSYVDQNHGWYHDMIGPAKHYRVWTENEVIDVVSCESPIIEPWPPPNTAVH